MTSLDLHYKVRASGAVQITAVKELQTARSSLTARHPERTTNGYDKEIDTGTDRKTV